MREKRRPASPTEARRSLYALAVLSGKVTEPSESKPRKRKRQRESQVMFEDYLIKK